MPNISSYTLVGRVTVANLKMGGVISPGEVLQWLRSSMLVHYWAWLCCKMGGVWRGNWWPKNLHMHQRKGVAVLIWLLVGICEWVWWWVDDMYDEDLKMAKTDWDYFWSAKCFSLLLENRFFLKSLRQKVGSVLTCMGLLITIGKSKCS